MQTKQDPREPVLLRALEITQHAKFCLSVIALLIGIVGPAYALLQSLSYLHADPHQRSITTHYGTSLSVDCKYDPLIEE